MYDIAVIGGGISGMATAARLQRLGRKTIVLEAHGRIGGCAGYFRRNGFAFDVGATTLVDFEPGGVGGELLDSIGLSLDADFLPGYVAWLPDRTVTLHRDAQAWAAERLAAFGTTDNHRRLWVLLDELAAVFWDAARQGIKLPLRTLADACRSARIVGLRHLPLARYALWTMSDALRQAGLREDVPLCALLSMLVEDTVHSTLDRAPLVNAALGITIRGAGLARHPGGMYGFWRRFAARYRALGGDLRVGCPVSRVEGQGGHFRLHTPRGEVWARQVVAALPPDVTARLAPDPVARSLVPYLERDKDSMGGAVIVFLGVPENEVAGHPFTHHQLLQDYARPLGDGNNMFVSVSAPGDLDSAPAGYRAVMISTHTDLDQWQRLSSAEYAAYKRAYGDCLVDYARRVYPNLGTRPLVYEIGTPATYAHFTRRPRGAVGGVRQTLRNANQFSVPYETGLDGFWLVGDGTWPGLGTVACVLGSRLVAEGVERLRRKRRW